MIVEVAEEASFLASQYGSRDAAGVPALLEVLATGEQALAKLAAWERPS